MDKQELARLASTLDAKEFDVALGKMMAAGMAELRQAMKPAVKSKPKAKPKAKTDE